MKAFLIHSFSDKEKIDVFVDKYKKYKKLRISRLECSYRFIWRSMSIARIIKSDFVIFIVGENSHQSKNISWELKVAKKFNKKIYVIKLDARFHLPDEIDDIEVIKEEELNSFIEIELDINKKIENNLFNNKDLLENNPEAQKLLLEEYKLLLQTSEALVVRRQTMNTFFLTANGLLVTMLGLITGAKIGSNYSYIYLCALTFVGILLCLSWSNLVLSYGQLNTGKFAVLNKLEKYLPASIFAAEWVALGEGKDKKKYKSFTQSEKKIPMLFLLVYIIALVTIIVFKVDIVRETIKFYISKV
ncbi:hypothetical protein FDC58_15520 [Clostridium botulinum]|uniref:RipA family octameric membrane protein n=1 Tax=unclassified Clostridium TaxID=2614128 RepID=UPI0013C79FAD|nr:MULTISPECIES: hypothetical protein [unclassified Clostridium]MBY7008396.1 hypothetical protein [Clostridium botulinum]NFH73031.1 hypothetical protein [Clostridium botulinum]NFI01205.1 hypothetical protein [Clostridium botulinum]NFI63576.1 hypothetical protein [Clostridium botulinum]NFI81808.1 hypothetical protein [Clostridium botulinum]